MTQHEHQEALFQDLPTPSTDPKPKRSNPIAKIEELDPSACSLWPGNPRIAERLDEKKLEDLIASIDAVGQSVPVVARKHEEGYEVIVGSRRLIAAKRIQAINSDFKLRAEVGVFNDKEAFQLAHSENGERANLSVFETAISLNRALETHYENSQRKLAQSIGKSETWVSRHILIAKNLSEYFELFPNWDAISFRQALAYASRIEESPNLADSLKQLKSEQPSIGGLPSMEVNGLFADTSTTNKSPGFKTTYGPAKKPTLLVKKHSATSLTVSVPMYEKMDRDAIEKAFNSCLDRWISS